MRSESMRHPTTVLLLLVAVFSQGLPLPAAAASGEQAVVHGTAAYRERIMLPPNAVFEATLEDVSRADVAAPVLGTVRIENAGGTPYEFEIPYDPADIDERMSYSVRARVTVEDQLVFTTDTAYPVLTRGHGPEVEMLLKRVPGSPSGERPAPSLSRLPSTFKGTLPCADCPGIDTHLNLVRDDVFVLRTVYRERSDRTFDDVGLWSIGSDGTTLVLSGGREAPLYFRIVDSSTLRKLDMEGHEIDSEVDHDLRRASEFELIEPTLPLSGLFRYFADAALFQACLTGHKYPVAQEGDYLALETAYLEASEEAGAPMLVALEGSLALRTPMEGEGQRPTLIVERFGAVHPGEECGPRPVAAELAGPRWELVKMGDEAIVPADDRERIHIEFVDKGSKTHGFAGCNRFNGGYELDGPNLTFGPAAMTMMACAEGMEEEQRFSGVLAETASWRILGRVLELFDAEGGLLARFTAAQAVDSVE